MKVIHGYRKGECDPIKGQQLTICGRPIYKIDRYTVRIPDTSGLKRQPQLTAGVTCSSCLARISTICNQKLPHAV